MKNYSNIYRPNQKNLSKCSKILKNHGVCALPTETVYGLAGNAYSEKAIHKIYKLKKRPRKNPLIVHFDKLQSIRNETEHNVLLSAIYKKFSPGPITYVLKLKKTSKISKKITNKNGTIACRVPANKYFRKIIKLCGSPLAAPSANISNNLSPTSSYDVYDEFKEKIKFIIDGGPSKIGLESTVVDLTGKPKILRPGIISPKKIGKVLKSRISIIKSFKKIKSPGSIKKHYSPGIPMKLNQKKALINCAFIILGKKYKKTKDTFNLSKKSNLNEAAKNLYKIFRIIKKKKYKIIHVVKIPNKGIGIAINDRLKHAAN